MLPKSRLLNLLMAVCTVVSFVSALPRVVRLLNLKTGHTVAVVDRSGSTSPSTVVTERWQRYWFTPSERRYLWNSQRLIAAAVARKNDLILVEEQRTDVGELTLDDLAVMLRSRFIYARMDPGVSINPVFSESCDEADDIGGPNHFIPSGVFGEASDVRLPLSETLDPVGDLDLFAFSLTTATRVDLQGTQTRTLRHIDFSPRSTGSGDARAKDATGFYYYRARYYSPGVPRFTSQDPIHFGGNSTTLLALSDLLLKSTSVGQSQTSGTSAALAMTGSKSEVILASISIEHAGVKIDWPRRIFSGDVIPVIVTINPPTSNDGIPEDRERRVLLLSRHVSVSLDGPSDRIRVRGVGSADQTLIGLTRFAFEVTTLKRGPVELDLVVTSRINLPTGVEHHDSVLSAGIMNVQTDELREGTRMLIDNWKYLLTLGVSMAAARLGWLRFPWARKRRRSAGFRAAS